MERPKIVCLCGSTRFKAEFEEVNERLTCDGVIVLTVGSFALHGRLRSETKLKTKEMLDWLHKRKIDLADEVLVLNVGGCIGDSTRGEIDYAIAHGKPVRYMQPHESERPENE